MCEVDKMLGISFGPVQSILKERQYEVWNSVICFLYHYKTPTHSTLYVCDFLAKNKIIVIPHPPYAPDLALCDCFHSLKLQNDVKEKEM